MPPAYIKKYANMGTVYLDEGNRPIPISSFEEEPIGFPFTDTLAGLRARFGNLQMIENPNQPPVSGTIISDAAVASDLANVNSQLNKIAPHGPSDEPRPPTPPLTPAPIQAKESVSREGQALEVFKEMLQRWHYAAGKEKKELARDIEAVGAFLIEIDPSVEPLLQSMKDNITTQRKRFSL